MICFGRCQLKLDSLSSFKPFAYFAVFLQLAVKFGHVNLLSMNTIFFGSWNFKSVAHVGLFHMNRVRVLNNNDNINRNYYVFLGTAEWPRWGERGGGVVV